MIGVAAYHVPVCALFSMQVGMLDSTYLPALKTTRTQKHDMLPHPS
jgi:hypothetical protein